MLCGTCRGFAPACGRAWLNSPLRWTRWLVIALAANSGSLKNDSVRRHKIRSIHDKKEARDGRAGSFQPVRPAVRIMLNKVMLIGYVGADRRAEKRRGAGGGSNVG